jgi:hypothetical protein
MTERSFGRRRHAVLAAAAVFLSVAASGCATEPGGILRTVDLKKDQFFTTDARQRVVTNSEIGENSSPGLPDPFRLVCTEPSPDVAIAVANSFGAGVSVFGQGSGSISATTVQSMAQLVERTASIQLLRDKMYQTCLAYSNGAITGTTYSLVMSKLDDTILSLLLGETAGGAFGRKLAALGTEAEAEAEASLQGAQQISQITDDLAVAQKEVDEKQATLREKQAIVDSKQAPSQEEKDAVTKAQGELDQAKARRDALVASLQSKADTMAKSSGKATFQAGGGIDAKTDPLIADSLRQMQEEFLSKDFSDFFVQACLIELGIADGKFAARTSADQKIAAAAEIYPPPSGLKPPSSLGVFCLQNLKEFIATAHDANVMIRGRRLDVALKSVEVRAKVAEADADRSRARAEEAKAKALQEFNTALGACNAVADAEVKKTCIGKIP